MFPFVFKGVAHTECAPSSRWWSHFGAGAAPPDHFWALAPRDRLSHRFSIISGPCEISTEGCVSSPRYPDPYRNKEKCQISATVQGVLKVEHFRTEEDFDKLTVGATAYSGDSSPDCVAVDPTTSISWSADDSTTEAGWELCLDVAAGGESDTIANQIEELEPTSEICSTTPNLDTDRRWGKCSAGCKSISVCFGDDGGGESILSFN